MLPPETGGSTFFLTKNEIGVRGSYDALVLGCTAVDNEFGILGLNSGLVMSINSSITWGNVREFLGVGFFSTWSACYSLFPFEPALVCAAREDNLHFTPQFWSEAGGDFHLHPCWTRRARPDSATACCRST